MRNQLKRYMVLRTIIGFAILVAIGVMMIKMFITTHMGFPVKEAEVLKVLVYALAESIFLVIDLWISQERSIISILFERK